MKKNPKLYIIGARGYIGNALYKSALNDYNVTGTSSTETENMQLFSIGRPEEFDYKSVCDGDVVCLSSAISSPDVCANDFEKAWKVNVDATTAFINNLTKVGAKVIFFSSDAVYGEHTDGFDEAQACNPAGAYAIMKHEVENRFVGNRFFKSIRLSYVFSRQDKFTKYLISCAQNGELAEVFHPFIRSVVHLDDVVKGILALADRWNEFPDQFINFGGPSPVSRVQIAESLKATFLSDLEFDVIIPSDSFFENRPRAIAMQSPLLVRLLCRPPLSILKAATKEFENR